MKLKEPYYTVFAIKAPASILCLSVFEDNIQEAYNLFNRFKQQYQDHLIILSDKKGKVLKRFSIRILQ